MKFYFLPKNQNHMNYVKKLIVSVKASQNLLKQ